MRTKLKEGMVIRSDKFANGSPGETDIQAGDKFVITEVREKFPHSTIGNRTSSYENSFVAKRLNADGSYNAEGMIIQFSTAFIFSCTNLSETDIEILDQMRKVFVLESHLESNPPNKWTDFDKKIKEYEALQNEVIAENLAFESLSEEEKLAIRLHAQHCTSSHEDMCSWHYEIDKVKGHNWEGSAHKLWLRDAKQFIESASELGVQVDAVLQVLEKLKTREVSK